MRLVPTKAGQSFVVDDEDFDRVMEHRWYVTPNGGYAYTVLYENGKRRSLRMQRFILNPPSDKVVDHINGDVTDNRKCNLRLATIAENSRNAKPKGKHPGARKCGKRWNAMVTVNRQHFCIGKFDTAEEASAAYFAALPQYHGEFAITHRL